LDSAQFYILVISQPCTADLRVLRLAEEPGITNELTLRW
jgi:hypothetical protein